MDFLVGTRKSPRTREPNTTLMAWHNLTATGSECKMQVSNFGRYWIYIHDIIGSVILLHCWIIISQFMWKQVHRSVDCFAHKAYLSLNAMGIDLFIYFARFIYLFWLPNWFYFYFDSGTEFLFHSRSPTYMFLIRISMSVVLLLGTEPSFLDKVTGTSTPI